MICVKCLATIITVCLLASTVDMGIRGLRSFLDERVRVSKRVLPTGSTLVVDGDGWMFHLLQLCKGEMYMDMGGSYGDYALAISAEIHKLQSCGLKLLVLFDGPKNSVKERTTNERLKVREDEWTSLHKFCNNESSVHHQHSFPLAPLCKEQLLAILDTCSVRYQHCTNEADQEIALLVQQQNLLSTSEPCCFAYALDSDYLVMKDCPYIEFGSIKVTTTGNPCAPVWSRIDVCRGLCISEAQFLDFVLFLGNDYTAPLVVHTDLYATMQRSFKGNARAIMQDWLGKVANQRMVQLHAADLFQPHPPHGNAAAQDARMQQMVDLQFTIDFSRALYNLEPLDQFYEYVWLTFPPTVPYSSAPCVFDFHHYSDTSEGKFFADLSRYVKAAGKMGTQGVDRGVAVHALTYLKRKCATPANTNTAAGPVVTDEHRAAIQAMLQQLQQHPSGTKMPARGGKLAFRPQWEDLLAAYVYQKTCALMIKSFPRSAFVGDHNTPVKIFDGAIFHAALCDLRAVITCSDSVRVDSLISKPSFNSAVTQPTNVPGVTKPAKGPVVTKPTHASSEPPSKPLHGPVRKPSLAQAQKEEQIALWRYNTRQSQSEREEPNIIASDHTIDEPSSWISAATYPVNTAASFWVDDDLVLPTSTSPEILATDFFEAEPVEILRSVNSQDEECAIKRETELQDESYSAPSHLPVFSSSYLRKESVPDVVLSTSLPAETVISRYQAPKGPKPITKAERKAERKAQRRLLRERRGHKEVTLRTRERPVRQAPPVPVTAVLDAASPLVASNPFEQLPIDAHRETILRHIHQNRVTIIHGETGCGKSSRLPQFLLEDCEASNRPCKIFVSQPRRIGVVGMLKRLRPVLGDKVGIRMGYGVRDETADTKLHYVTTGYLVQLVAHHPAALKRCTHIVIDEVHERSVDGDLICLLVRDLLLENSKLRVILMSATINTDLYQEYFAQYDDGSFGQMDGLFVGVKRFPVEIHYLEDLLTKELVGKAGTDEVLRHVRKVSEENFLAPAWVEAQYNLVVALLRTVCKTGSTVLVFISGMDDIMSIAALLEPYPQFLVCPLHSTTPEEEQDLAFEPTPLGNVKVVLATNMAESSVTIPDCDVVICLGTHKAVSFSDSLQRTHVAFGLISRASATQRAGRTGRVRPGTVYRLYTKETYQKMKEHELAEVLRRPLDDVVLNMWTVLENAENFQGVTPFLNRLMEAPDMKYIEKSYEKLFEASLITFPSDDGCLTPAGRFVSALPLDLSLGRMLSYGVLLGVPAEAVVMAAALSLPRTPYRIGSSLFLDPNQFNAQIRRRFEAEVRLDQGDYSEPIALVRLLLEWRALDSDKARNIFCYKNNLQISIMKQFESAAVSLAREVERLQPFQHGTAEPMNLDSIGKISPKTINLLRLIMAWSFSENIMQLQRHSRKLKKIVETKGTIKIESDRLSETHLKTLFGHIPYVLNVQEDDSCYSFDHKIDWSGPDPFSRFVSLLDRLATVSESNSVRCFAVVVESPDVEVNLVVFVVLSGETQSDLIEQFHADVLSEEHFTQDHLAQRLLNECSNIYDRDAVYTCDDASQSEVINLYEMLRRVGDAITMTVKVNESACLKSAKTMLSAETLAFIFGIFYTKKKQLKTLVMSFPPEKKTTLSFPEEASKEWKRTALIEDLPLGHRFIECCRASHKNYKLVVKLQASEVTEEDLAAQVKEVPYKVKRPEKCPQRVVNVWSVTPNWQYFYNGSQFPAKLPRQSMMSASFHCGFHPLYAVAHSVLPVTKLTGTNFVVGGVTFLPTDPTWLQLAMRTIGKDHILNNLWEDADKEEAREVPQQLLDLARDVDNAVQDASEFVRRDDIIDKVLALFAQYTIEPEITVADLAQEDEDVVNADANADNSNNPGNETVEDAKNNTELNLSIGIEAAFAALDTESAVTEDVQVNCGDDQAKANKSAHDWHSRAAADTSCTTLQVTLPEPTVAHSTTHHRVGNNDSVRSRAHSQCVLC